MYYIWCKPPKMKHYLFVFLLLAGVLARGQQISKLNLHYAADQVQLEIGDARSLVIAGTLLTCSSVGFGAAARGIGRLVYNAQYNHYEKELNGSCSPGGCSRPLPKMPVDHSLAATYGVAVPIACAGLALTAIGATRLVQWKARKRELKMQTGILNDGTVGLALAF